MNFENVTAVAKANIYFDGKVVSHTVLMPNGAKKTLGVIYPGSYHFGTGAPERMEREHRRYDVEQSNQRIQGQLPLSL